MEQPGDYCITYNGALVQKAADGQHREANRSLSYDDYVSGNSPEVGFSFHALDAHPRCTPTIVDIALHYTVNSFVATIPLVFCGETDCRSS